VRIDSRWEMIREEGRDGELSRLADLTSLSPPKRDSGLKDRGGRGL
jgi:hypothetical protein